MKKYEFIEERTRIISEMLDNPDKIGIYPTTRCFEQLDELFDEIIASTKTHTGEQGIKNMKADLREIIEACGEWEDFDIVLREVLDDLDRESWEREQEGRN